MPEQQNMYAHRLGGGLFNHVFKTESQVRLCGSEEIIPVVVTVDEEGDHWGWQDNDGRISLIFDSSLKLEMCFPYGITVAEKQNKGRRVRLAVKEMLED